MKRNLDRYFEGTKKQFDIKTVLPAYDTEITQDEENNI